MTTPSDSGQEAVALVIQRRIADEGFADFTRWNGKVAETLKAWPGFLGQEIIPPQPPAHVDWVSILHFSNPPAARGWLQSGERALLLDEIRQLGIGPEDVHLLPDAGRQADRAVSALISFKVPEALEKDFFAWQQRIQAAEARFPGFLRHKIERPIPGLHDDWVVVLSFDDDANLAAWLESPERQSLLAQGARFNAGLNIKRASHGFSFWFPDAQATLPSRAFIFQSNLLVLLVLYPVVYLWGFFIGVPWLDGQGLPFWLTLFIGNFVSTQLLGWWLAPLAFRAFGWWLKPQASPGRQAAGYVLLAGLYAVSMVGFALLLAWGHGR